MASEAPIQGHSTSQDCACFTSASSRPTRRGLSSFRPHAIWKMRAAGPLGKAKGRISLTAGIEAQPSWRQPPLLRECPSAASPPAAQSSRKYRFPEQSRHDWARIASGRSPIVFPLSWRARHLPRCSFSQSDPWSSLVQLGDGLGKRPASSDMGGHENSASHKPSAAQRPAKQRQLTKNSFVPGYW
jgi:hypothetical protein